MDKSKPTIEQCLATIRELNKDVPQPEELLKQKANWLYLLNRLSFWDDIPVLMDIVNYERLKGPGHNYT
jgi:hypothetical protein